MMTTPPAMSHRGASRTAAARQPFQALRASEVGVRGPAGVVSPRAIGRCSDFAVTASTSTIERAYRVR